MSAGLSIRLSELKEIKDFITGANFSVNVGIDAKNNFQINALTLHFLEIASLKFPKGMEKKREMRGERPEPFRRSQASIVIPDRRVCQSSLTPMYVLHAV